MKRTTLLASLGVGVGVILSGGLVLAGSLSHNKYLSMFDAVGKSQEYRPHVVVQPKQAEKPEEVKAELASQETPNAVSSKTTSTSAVATTAQPSDQPANQPSVQSTPMLSYYEISENKCSGITTYTYVYNTGARATDTVLWPQANGLRFSKSTIGCSSTPVNLSN